MDDLQRKEATDRIAERQRPIRVGIFASIAAADRAVEQLLGAGFTKDSISVICSNQAIEQHFKAFEHQDPAGMHAPAATLIGGTIGAVLGGLSVAAGAVATGGLALLATAPIAMWGGFASGGLIGAMMTRGVEKELANYYDQAVAKGRILVAAESHETNHAEQLAIAERIFTEAGAEPISLSEG
ncbi:MAG: hypothetical protein K8T91_07845 [Planctomycetes bacterium]|nr:hypothetical protein [Planctomycetota bacterium]